MDTEKIKFSIRMDEELVRTADAYVQEGMALSRTEMIEDALRFYLGFLSAEKSEDYLLPSGVPSGNTVSICAASTSTLPLPSHA